MYTCTWALAQSGPWVVPAHLSAICSNMLIWLNGHYATLWPPPPAVRIRVNQENMNLLKYMKVHHKWLEASKDKFQDSSYFDFFWVVNMVTVKFCVQIHFPLIVRFLKLTFLWLSNLQDNFPLIVQSSKWSFLWLSDFQNDLSSDCPIFKKIFPLIVPSSKLLFLCLSDF